MLKKRSEPSTSVSLESFRAAENAAVLFGGLRQHHLRRLRQPSDEEGFEPGALDHVMDRASLEMSFTRLRARQLRVAVRGPAAHHPVGHVGMKLQAERIVPLERLHREVVTFG